MKKQLLVILSLLALTACGSDSTEDLQLQESQVLVDSIPTLEGEFIFLAGEAVIKGDTFVYGIEMDSLALQLADQVEGYKKDKFDMIPVKVKAKVKRNPRANGWDELIEIRELLSISAPEVETAEDSLQ